MWTFFGIHFFSAEEKQQIRNMYTTQRDMIEAGGIIVNGGLCQPLASTWLEGQIDGTGCEYLKDKHLTLQRALAVNEAQRVMRDQGEDYKSYAFVKTNTPYAIQDIPISTLITPEGVKETLSSHEYALFSYQTKEDGPRHALAFSNTSKKDNKCRVFDADRYAGIVTGPCDVIMNVLAVSFKISAELREGEVARITLSTQKKLH